MKTENVDPMNTEQLKTAEQIYEDNVGSNMELGYIRTPKENVIQAMQIFASQESNKAVDEFKEKLMKEINSLPNGTVNRGLFKDLIDKL